MMPLAHALPDNDGTIWHSIQARLRWLILICTAGLALVHVGIKSNLTNFDVIYLFLHEKIFPRPYKRQDIPLAPKNMEVAQRIIQRETEKTLPHIYFLLL